MAKPRGILLKAVIFKRDYSTVCHQTASNKIIVRDSQLGHKEKGTNTLMFLTNIYIYFFQLKEIGLCSLSQVVSPLLYHWAENLCNRLYNRPWIRCCKFSVSNFYIISVSIFSYYFYDIEKYYRIHPPTYIYVWKPKNNITLY